MTKYINLHKNYKSNSGNYQLKLPLNIDCLIPDNDSVRLLSQFVEEMDLEDLYSTCPQARENQATICQMLKSVNTIYTREDCSNCPDKSKCIKGNNCKTPLEERTKNLKTSKVFKIQSDRTGTHLFPLKKS